MKPDAIFKGSSLGKKEESQDGETDREKKQEGKKRQRREWCKEIMEEGVSWTVNREVAKVKTLCPFLMRPNRDANQPESSKTLLRSKHRSILE